MLNLDLFTELQGNMLIKLLIAHLIVDFILQTKKMVKHKKWLSSEMFLHIFLVFIITFLFSENLIIALIISTLHYIIDGLKMEIKKMKFSETYVFIGDQILHIASIIAVWSVYFDINKKVVEALFLPFTNYSLSIIVLAYLLVTTPFGYFIGLITKRFQNNDNDEIKTDKNGLYIGIFERIIILTFILLGEYSAIGFLITGKSIIRFSSKNEDIKSEYVLLGTMISYGITIITGIIIKHLL